jgi:tetratricopeptide (TPR) repeat protein
MTQTASRQQQQLQQLLDAGLAHHNHGRIDEAESLYRQMIALEANDPRALHLLGVIASQRGDKPGAVQLIRRAIEIAPLAPEYHSNIALVYLEQGIPDLAVQHGRRAIELDPSQAEPHFIYANALRDVGRHDDAIAMYHRAIQLNARHTGAMRNLGRLLTMLGRRDDAMNVFRALLNILPDWPEALLDYAELLRNMGKLPDALAAFDRVIAIAPNHTLAHNGRGLVLTDKNDLAAAAEAYSRALEFDPHNAGIRNNLGYVLELVGRFDEALQELERAAADRPDLVDAVGNLANTFRDLGRWGDALAQYNRALRLQPDSHRVRFNRALLLLLLGQFEEGWTEYEWRWLLFPQHKRTFMQPRWLDGDIRGRTLFIYAEQGFGDTIQFVRYIPMIAKLGATVILEVHAELHALLKDVPGVAQCLKRNQALLPFDCQAPMMSLPLSFQTFAPEKIPADPVPYLFADPIKVEAWRQRVCTDGAPPAKLRIGVAWAGDPTHRLDLMRSCTLSRFAEISKIPGVVIYSLQKGGRAAKPEDVPPGMTFHDFTADLHDFSDTAALMMNLDLVISVDTAVVHLAGALGRPVFTLLPFNPDFRWLIDRPDTPWYPTMKLFRPPTPMDWDSVFADVLREVKAMLKG